METDTSSDLSLMVKGYQHEPLDDTRQQIRLISMRRPSGNDNSIHCAIGVFDISEAPPYTALSYVWGPPTPTYPIYIDGYALLVRENLYRFLEAFQQQKDKESSDEYIWIDQISIDQSNYAERGHQVPMMAQIYGNCESAVAWLGESYEPLGRWSYYQCAQAYRSKGSLIALKRLFCNNYFNRLWIVQELYLPRRVRVLVKNIWVTKDISTIRHHFNLMSGRIPPRSIRILVKDKISQKNNMNLQPLHSILWKYYQQQCEDPRDNVYGLLGLVTPEDRGRIEIDYRKSQHQVFMDAVLAICASFTENSTQETNAPYQQCLALGFLSDNMEFTAIQRQTILSFLTFMVHGRKLGRFRGKKCPITTAGFELADDTHSVDRWTYELMGTTYYIPCKELDSSDVIPSPHSDWIEYLPTKEAELIRPREPDEPPSVGSTKWQWRWGV